MTARTVPEWIAKHPDQAVPPRVELRILLANDRRCACGCNRIIAPGEAWEIDHIIALINGGEHRESNLRPMLYEHHKLKSHEDVAAKSRTYRKRAKNYGIRQSSHPIHGWKTFSGEPVTNPKLKRSRSTPESHNG